VLRCRREQWERDGRANAQYERVITSPEYEYIGEWGKPVGITTGDPPFLYLTHNAIENVAACTAGLVAPASATTIYL
jgi:hypothetical protein